MAASQGAQDNCCEVKKVLLWKTYIWNQHTKIAGGNIFSVFRPACIDDDDSSFNASSSCVVLTTTSLVIWGPFYLMLILHRTDGGGGGE